MIAATTDLHERRAEHLLGVFAEIKVLLIFLLVRLAKLIDGLIDLLRLLAEVANALLVGLAQLLAEILNPALGQNPLCGLRQHLPHIALARLRAGAAAIGCCLRAAAQT